MEDSISMPELVEILVAKRKNDYENRRFFAALQGVNLDESSGNEKRTASFEDIKARVFSGGQARDANDVLALQGINARQKGFGIGMGLEYTDAKDLENPSW